MVDRETAIVAAVMSLPAIYATEPEPVLNFRFVGAVSIKVLFV
jgi:hypothetical protein